MRPLRVLLVLASTVPAWAAAGGSLSGIIKDSSGAFVPRARVTLVDSALNAQFKTISDARRALFLSRRFRWAATIYESRLRDSKRRKRRISRLMPMARCALMRFSK